jgi:mannonate dehydratase
MDAVRFAQALEPFDLFFSKTPFPWNRRVAASAALPYDHLPGQGELFSNPSEWKDIITNP